MNSLQNLSLYYYRDKEYGKNIEKYKLTYNFDKYFKIKDVTNFKLCTDFPGFTIGLSYPHFTKKKKDSSKEQEHDFSQGFLFDHTTGMPYINGSAIKGFFKSFFPSKNDKYKKEKEEYLKEEYLEKDININLLKEELFEKGKVIFHDAYIPFWKNKQKVLFDNDYITYHNTNEEDGELKEPIPIKYLKIRAGIVYSFQFEFKDKDLEKYIELFKYLLKNHQLGSRTNNSYGRFKECSV